MRHARQGGVSDDNSLYYAEAVNGAVGGMKSRLTDFDLYTGYFDNLTVFI